ncbi:MAG: hypothetical protein SFV53_01805 [Rickettsiales bacterium]|nr:hypothetical protein [Rickettsiales bacterium]
MIDLHNISQQKPEIVLRGEYGIIVGDSLIIAPNAKNGKIVIMIDAEKQIAAIAHFDAAQKVEENMTNILNDMRKIGSEISEVKCSIMEKESHPTLIEKVQKSFKEKVEEVLQENGNDQKVNHTLWSGNDFCNVVLRGDGDIMIDNSSELMRAALNLLIFTTEGDERLNNALNPTLITELKKIKGSASARASLNNVKLIKQTPSTVFLKLSSETLEGKNKSKENSLS